MPTLKPFTKAVTGLLIPVLLTACVSLPDGSTTKSSASPDPASAVAGTDPSDQSVVASAGSGNTLPAAIEVEVPEFMSEIVATFSHIARSSPQVNQRSGVSVRMTVTNRETLVANAARRALQRGETKGVFHGISSERHEISDAPSFYE